MYSNQVRLLVDPPNGVKPIGCKWVYKRKSGVDDQGAASGKGLHLERMLRLRRDLLASDHDEVYYDPLIHCRSYGL